MSFLKKAFKGISKVAGFAAKIGVPGAGIVSGITSTLAGGSKPSVAQMVAPMQTQSLSMVRQAQQVIQQNRGAALSGSRTSPAVGNSLTVSASTTPTQRMNIPQWVYFVGGGLVLLFLFFSGRKRR